MSRRKKSAYRPSNVQAALQAASRIQIPTHISPSIQVDRVLETAQSYLDWLEARAPAEEPEAQAQEEPEDATK